MIIVATYFIFSIFFFFFTDQKVLSKVLKDSMPFHSRGNTSVKTQLFSVFTAYRQGAQPLQPGPVQKALEEINR